jgi:hypothetical protein
MGDGDSKAMAKSGELIILPPLGPGEGKALEEYLDAGYYGPLHPSKHTPFKISPKGITWDDTAFSYVSLEVAAQWLEKYIIPKFIKPLRHMSGMLVVPGEGSISVDDNDVAWTVSVIPAAVEEEEELKPGAWGYKADGTPKAKPGPKSGVAKTLKQILAEKKNGSHASVYEPGSATAEESTQIIAEMQEKIVALQDEVASLKKPKKSKVPAGKRWYRLTVSKDIDKEKFVEGLKLTVMGIDGDIEVFE